MFDYLVGAGGKNGVVKAVYGIGMEASEGIQKNGRRGHVAVTNTPNKEVPHARGPIINHAMAGHRMDNNYMSLPILAKENVN